MNSSFAGISGRGNYSKRGGGNRGGGSNNKQFYKTRGKVFKTPARGAKRTPNQRLKPSKTTFNPELFPTM